MFFALKSSFCRETEFTKFVSEEIATALSRHASKRRRIPMPPARRRARCSRHEARAGIVALMSCCLVRFSTVGLGPAGEIISLPACMQRSIRRDAALASRLGPLACSGDMGGRSKALFYAVLNGTSISDPELVNFFMRLRQLGLRPSHFRVDRKLRSHQLPRSCCNCTVARLASRACVADDFCNSVTTPLSLL